ncbi:MAG: hypothetical protein OEZ33_01705, partial [Gammaproteobacteria bacterium]|nr:hypothetical protein [Gammaproteobacteria bacterium]
KQTANDNTAPQATLNKKIEKPMRVLRMESGMDSRSQIRELKSLNKNKNYSEIFQDGKAGSGRKRALPGNIIVHLNPDWNQQEVDDWLSRNNLQLVKKFDFGKNILLIKTSAGLVSLQKANEIYNTGEVVAAYPNWWKEVSKK